MCPEWSSETFKNVRKLWNLKFDLCVYIFVSAWDMLGMVKGPIEISHRISCPFIESLVLGKKRYFRNLRFKSLLVVLNASQVPHMIFNAFEDLHATPTGMFCIFLVWLLRKQFPLCWIETRWFESHRTQTMCKHQCYRITNDVEIQLIKQRVVGWWWWWHWWWGQGDVSCIWTRK